LERRKLSYLLQVASERNIRIKGDEEKMHEETNENYLLDLNSQKRTLQLEWKKEYF